jgi:hypothetical protein
MANPVLFRSSAAVAVVHAAALARYGVGLASPSRALLVATIVVGLATSLWNHGASSRAAQLVDRAAMWAGFCVDLYLSWHVPDAARWGVCCASLVAAAALYFLAKWVLLRSGMGVEARSVSLEIARAGRARWSKLPAADMPHVLAHVTLTTTHMLLLDAYAAL